MLELHIQNAEQTDAVVPVRWCISAGTSSYLVGKGALEPYLLLVVIHKIRNQFSEKEEKDWIFGERDRFLVKLSQGMQYVQFNQPGKHIIRGIILWVHPDAEYDKRGSFSFIRNTLLKRYNNNRYTEDLVDRWTGQLQEGVIESATRDSFALESSCSIEVNVGEDFFAPEPAKWEQWWVNLWYSCSARDQCEFRRRRALAYTLQPLVLSVWIPFLCLMRFIVACLGLFWGSRMVSLRPILHPFDMYLGDVVAGDVVSGHRQRSGWGIENNFFCSDKDGNYRSSWFFLLHPICLTLFGLMGVWIYFKPVPALTVLSIVGGGAIVSWIYFFVKKKQEMKRAQACCRREQDESTAKKKEREKELEMRRNEAQARAAEALKSELQDVVCTGSAPPTTVAALPKRRQTLSLRFQETKADVCRPFRR